MRDKLYYPDNEITKNLYTFGNEFMLSNIEYKGFYHKYSTGEIYTLKEWNPLLSNKLLPFEDTSGLKFRYKQLKPNNPLDLYVDTDFIVPGDINSAI